MSHPMEIEPRVATLLSAAGMPDKIDAIETLSAGGNNRTYRVTTVMGTCVAKQYFSHAGDLRDRLGSEFSFLTYAGQAAPGWAPAALAADRETSMALYEFVPGQPLRPGEVTTAHVDDAARFFLALNAADHRATAQLAIASEACFSIEEHLELIDARLEQLLTIEQHEQEDSEARDLIEAVETRWQTIKAAIYTGSLVSGVDITARLEKAQYCISPSDFGFHNALMQPDGQLRFIDFEYAGWDDPAKMIGDFFAQLAVPVSDEHFDRFIEACLVPFPRYEALLARARLLRPAYQIKWCCIALNVFLPIGLARRKFASPDLDKRALKRNQLAKANRLFESILTG
jgi:hypothetical protein